MALTIAGLKAEEERRAASTSNTPQEDHEVLEAAAASLVASLGDNSATPSAAASIDSASVHSTLPMTAWYDWTSTDWSSLSEYLQSATDSLTRQNAQVGIPLAASGEESDAVDPALADSPLFTDNAEKVYRYLQCNVALAPFRKALEDLVWDTSLPDTAKPDDLIEGAKLWYVDLPVSLCVSRSRPK